MANRQKQFVQSNKRKPTKVKNNIHDSIDRISELEKEVSRVLIVMQKKVDQLECLSSLGAILNSTLDTQSVREKTLIAICKLLDCETGSLLLVDTTKNELYWETALGVHQEFIKESFRLTIDRSSIAGAVVLEQQAKIVNDVQSSPFHFKKVDQSTQFKTKNMVCVPILSKGRVLGVLQAINKLEQDFLDEDRHLLEALSHQVAIALENANLYSKLKDTFMQTVSALAEAIEVKDHYTGGHTKRVLQYSLAIGSALKLSAEEKENLKLAAILHDIGKIGIDDKILKKQYALNDEEYEIMKNHPAIGYEILSHIDHLKDIVDGMRYHHERPDGTGYPYGLKGKDIPKIASIISVADTYDAMVSTRSYRKGLDPQIAFEEITKYRGTQFDAEVVDAFVDAFKSGSLRRRQF